MQTSLKTRVGNEIYFRGFMILVPFQVNFSIDNINCKDPGSFTIVSLLAFVQFKNKEPHLFLSLIKSKRKHSFSDRTESKFCRESNELITRSIFITFLFGLMFGSQVVTLITIGLIPELMSRKYPMYLFRVYHWLSSSID